MNPATQLEKNLEHNIRSLVNKTSKSHVITLILKQAIKLMLQHKIELKAKTLPEEFDIKVLILKKITSKSIKDYVENMINTHEVNVQTQTLLNIAQMNYKE